MREKIPQIPQKEINPRQKLRGEKKFDPSNQKELTTHLFRYWRGDAHTHSQESSREGWGYPEGIYSEEEVMEYYQGLGLEFVAFSEHASKPGQPEKLATEHPISQSFLNQAERIEKLNQEGGFEISAFSSTEANVFFDEENNPTIYLPEEVLQKLDLVIASRHSIANEKDITAIKKSLLFAINNDRVDVIGHPDRYIRLEGGIKDGENPCSEEVYWNTWEEILDAMEQKGKAFEINFNNPPSDELLEKAAQKNIKFMLNYDAHDFHQYKREGPSDQGTIKKWAKEEASDEDLEILQRYKLERLTSGPGAVAILRLARFIRKLDKLKVTPDRIINSSRENIISFLTEDRNKSTKNLEFLKEKFKTQTS